jgi:hypothetical protein
MPQLFNVFLKLPIISKDTEDNTWNLKQQKKKRSTNQRRNLPAIRAVQNVMHNFPTGERGPFLLPWLNKGDALVRYMTNKYCLK